MNWRAYLRLEKLFLKMFQVEPRVPVRMLLDTSESMTAHGGAEIRLWRANWPRRSAMSGWCGWTPSRSTAFASRLTQRMFCTGGRHRFTGVMDASPALTAGGATDYLAVMREFIGAYSQRGLVIIISDFLDDNGCERALQYLSDFGHELMLLQVWADEDRTPPWTGELELRDAETGAALKLDFDEDARERYTRAFDEYCSCDPDARDAQRRPVRGHLHVAAAGERDLRRTDPGAGDRVNGA